MQFAPFAGYLDPGIRANRVVVRGVDPVDVGSCKSAVAAAMARLVDGFGKT